MRFLIFVAFFSILFPVASNASYIGLLDPRNWEPDHLSSIVMKEIYKRARKPEDVNVLYDVNYSSFQTAYRDFIATDIQRCSRVSHNPAWIDGIKIPVYSDSSGRKVYTVAENSTYMLAQRDLSKRGKERLRDHWFNWVITEGNNNRATIIQNVRKDDAYTPYKFQKSPIGSEIAVLNTVIANEWNISIGVSGKFDGNFTPIDSKLQGPKVGAGDGLVLSHCDSYKVKVVSNTAPVVHASVTKAYPHDADETPIMAELIYFFSIVNVDDKETHNDYLNYVWKITFKDGRTFHNKVRSWQLRHPTRLPEVISAELVVSDGSLSGRDIINNVDDIEACDYCYWIN